MDLQSLLHTASPGRPLLCMEVNPPRGVDLTAILKRLEGGALDGVDFLNITDSALARMKLAAIPLAAILKQRFGVEALVNISCRDRNLIAIQADLLGAWALGLRSVVALTGDAVSIGDSPQRKGVYEVNSIGLLNVIKTLNEGKDLAGNDLKGAPAIVPGVVVNPNANNKGAEIRRLAKKKDAGACYALSQPVFEEESSVQFFKDAADIGVPIFMGLLPIHSLHSAQTMSAIPGVKITGPIAEAVKSGDEARLPSLSIEHCMRLAEVNRPHVCGYHVITGASAKLAVQLTQCLHKYIANLPSGETQP
jgi:5,10-methylenetetrahydrofolate reductase